MYAWIIRGSVGLSDKPTFVEIADQDIVLLAHGHGLLDKRNFNFFQNQAMWNVKKAVCHSQNDKSESCLPFHG